MHRRVLLFIFAVATLTLASAHADVFLVSQIPGDAAPKITGDVAQVDARFTTASTFKIIIALAGLESGRLTPETTRLCNDTYLPQRPASLDLHAALFRSSNEYFALTARMLRHEPLEEMARRCEFGQVAQRPENLADWSHGGEVQISPREQHSFMRRLAAGKLPVKPEVLDAIVPTLEWPESGKEFASLQEPEKKDAPRYYGKTGSARGVLWFSGFVDKPDPRNADARLIRVITVLLTRSGATRDQAIQAFYDRAGE